MMDWEGGVCSTSCFLNDAFIMWSGLTRGGSFDTHPSLELRIHRLELFKERMRKQQSLSTAHGILAKAA